MSAMTTWAVKLGSKRRNPQGGPAKGVGTLWPEATERRRGRRRGAGGDTGASACRDSTETPALPELTPGLDAGPAHRPAGFPQTETSSSTACAGGPGRRTGGAVQGHSRQQGAALLRQTQEGRAAPDCRQAWPGPGQPGPQPEAEAAQGGGACSATSPGASRQRRRTPP